MIGADRFRPDSPQTPFLRALLPEAQAVGIALTGYQPHTAVLDAMASSAIVTVPSRWQEPFGLTALEAMACGAPLVCTRRGGLPEVAGEAAVYVPHDDPAALAAALRALATDARRRVELSQAGRARAALFDLAPAAARLTAFREELLGS
jgi:glycosyltransferase involved in cell wall biosynthesis